MAHIEQHPDRLPTHYPSHLEEEVVVAGGTRLWIRPVVPSDAPALAAEFAAADDDTVYMRFFNPYFQLTEDRLRYFTEIDYHRHVALAVMVLTPDGGAEGVAVGRYVARSDTDVEGAIVVKPPYRRIGVASLLLDRLVRIASANGFSSMSASYLVANDAAAGLLDRFGFRVVDEAYEVVDAILEFDELTASRRVG